MNQLGNGLQKIVVVGPESSGKSTICAALAAALDTRWVPEYARIYLEQRQKTNIVEEAELLCIAKGQLSAEDEAAANARRYLICDTDLHMVRIWSETMYRRCHRSILETIAIRPYDHYLLSYPDVPWEADPLRGYPDFKDRHYFYLQYLDIVINSGLPFTIIRGTQQERLSTAIQAITHQQSINYAATHSSR